MFATEKGKSEPEWAKHESTDEMAHCKVLDWVPALVGVNVFAVA
jgi:hypothetical protein